MPNDELLLAPLLNAGEEEGVNKEHLEERGFQGEVGSVEESGKAIVGEAG